MFCIYVYTQTSEYEVSTKSRKIADEMKNMTTHNQQKYNLTLQ